MNTDPGISPDRFAGPDRSGDRFGPVEYDGFGDRQRPLLGGPPGIDHPARAAGVLYPPMAANLTILALQTVAPGPLLHTRQRLDAATEPSRAPATLAVTGAVTDRFEQAGPRVPRGHRRDHAPTTSRSGPRSRPSSRPGKREARTVNRSLHLTAELLRRYSRRGNFHSDPDAAASIGYSRLVAQGMQVAGPAYGLLLDEWGEDFLDSRHDRAEVRRHGGRRRDRRGRRSTARRPGSARRSPSTAATAPWSSGTASRGPLDDALPATRGTPTSRGRTTPARSDG